jgi:hypothetical protein
MLSKHSKSSLSVADCSRRSCRFLSLCLSQDIMNCHRPQGHGHGKTRVCPTATCLRAQIKIIVLHVNREASGSVLRLSNAGNG